jgi:hypothetical protein
LAEFIGAKELTDDVFAEHGIRGIARHAKT